jgi:hypothetical protein
MVIFVFHNAKYSSLVDSEGSVPLVTKPTIEHDPSKMRDDPIGVIFVQLITFGHSRIECDSNGHKQQRDLKSKRMFNPNWTEPYL